MQSRLARTPKSCKAPWKGSSAKDGGAPRVRPLGKKTRGIRVSMTKQ